MTTTQMQTIASRRIDDTARAMMRDGLTLAHAERTEIGDAGHDWLCNRLGLLSRSTDAGVEYLPEPDAAAIRSLCVEAYTAGDMAQGALCERALTGDAAALFECAWVILRAAAMGA